MKVAACVRLAIAVLLLALGAGAAWAQPFEITIRGNQAHMTAMLPFIEEFNASQERIRVVYQPGGEEIEAITAAYLAGQLPDMIESAGVFNHAYAPQGWMASLEPFVAREGPDFMQDIFPATIDSHNRVNGVLYSIPIFLQIEGMYYNPEVFDRAAVAPPQPGWTWEDMRALSQRIRQYGPSGEITTWGLVARHPAQFDNVLIMQAGGVFVTRDYEVVVDSEPVRTAYTFILDMIDQDLLHYIRGIHSRAPSEEGRAHHTGLVSDATYRQHTWNELGSALRTAPPLRYQAGWEPVTAMSDRSLAIMNVAPERQEAAWEFIRWMMRPENLSRYTASLGYPPATRSAAQHPYFQEYALNNPNVLLWAEMYGSIKTMQIQPHGLPGITAMQEALLRGQITLAQFLEDATAFLTARVRELRDN